MEPEVTITQLIELYHSGGWAVVLPAALQLFVQGYSSLFAQSILAKFAPAWLLWENWGDWPRRAFMLVIGMAGGTVAHFAGGMPLAEVASKVIAITFGAHVLNASKRYSEEKKSSATELTTASPS